jgi:hypothetical protein
MHRLREVGLAFLDSAPHRFVFHAEVGAPRSEVFAAISADPSTWTLWFPGLDEGSYDGPGPHGVGSVRRVRMGTDVYRETMLAWDDPARWAYRVDESTGDLAHALVEDWAFDARDGATAVRWTFAIEPGPEMRDSIAAAEPVIGGVFEIAMTNLSARLTRTRRPTG